MRSMVARSGKTQRQTPARTIVAAPPRTTAGTAPSSAAATPDSNAPSSFEALMNTDSTAFTRPRSSFGAATAAIVERMFMLIMSTKPLTARAATESQSVFERPKTTIETPNVATTTRSVVPVRPRERTVRER